MRRLMRALALGTCVLAMPQTLGYAAQLNPKAVEVVKPESIKWVRNAAGT